MKLILFSLALYLGSFSLGALKAADIIGFYSDGSLLYADSVLDHRPKFSKLFLSRGKHYTSVEMRELLNEVALFTENRWPNSEPLQIGDLSAKGGGPIPRHASHQNGIDADVVYLRKDRANQDPSSKEWEEYFTYSGRISSNFDHSRNWELLHHIVSEYPVGRIFVDQVVKRELCSYAANEGLMSRPSAVEMLRRLRPARYHKTHFHIRLKCPEGHPHCEEQFEPPRGSGCQNLSFEVPTASC